ncbi:MAG: MmgE/PrpD family protein, partial [Actinobacteria bacterium]|nr:MmgE/PrpD family protein [Actinomycetota bacterium]
TLRRVIAAVAPEPAASIVGSDQRTTAPFAALANGYASHLQDFDDVFNPPQTTTHLGSCVWPVVLALGQTRPLDGPGAIAAFVAGFETGARVACAAGIRHYESSWQVSGTAGRPAAACAAARALGLSGEQATHALGIAAAQASGIREIYGSDTKALQPGKAAMDGVLAGLLAEQGFSARDTALEGERGLLSAISPAPEPGLLTDGLGSHWHLRHNGHKVWPGASLSHPAIDAAVAVHADPAFNAARVARIEARMLPFAAQVTSTPHPRPGPEAKFSAPHCLAIALLTGTVGLDAFGAEWTGHAAVTALRDRVLLIPDDSVGKRGAVVSARMTDGATVTRAVQQNLGTPENPLADADLEEKLHRVAAPLIGDPAVAEIIGYCWDLDRLPAVAEILAPVSKAMT